MGVALRIRRVLFAFVLFWILVVWGLRDCDVYPKEAAIYGAIWCALLAGFFLWPAGSIFFIVGMVLLDVVLLIKVLGQDIQLG